jgi:hypothetical protein
MSPNTRQRSRYARQKRAFALAVGGECADRLRDTVLQYLPVRNTTSLPAHALAEVRSYVREYAAVLRAQRIAPAQAFPLVRRMVVQGLGYKHITPPRFVSATVRWALDGYHVAGNEEQKQTAAEARAFRRAELLRCRRTEQ